MKIFYNLIYLSHKQKFRSQVLSRCPFKDEERDDEAYDDLDVTPKGEDNNDEIFKATNEDRAFEVV